MDLLDSLVRKSLVTVEQSGQHTRYGLLETIRQFAEEQMVVTGAVDDLRDRHARSFAEQAIAYWKIWDGPQQSVALEWLEVEFANLRTGFRWATSRGDFVSATAIAAHGTMLGWALERYEPVEWALEILADATRAELRQLPRLYTAASLCAFLGRVEMAVGYAQTAQQLENDSAMDGFAREFSRLLEANAHLYAGRTNRSLAIYKDVAALPEPANVSGLTGMLFALSSLGSVDEALALADRTLAAARLNGNPYWVAWSLWGYGQAFTTTDPARALNARRQGLIYSREHRLPFWEHLNAIDTASLETIHGEVGRGLELLDTVVEAFHRSGDVRSLARSLKVLVVSLDHLGRSASAATIYGTSSRTVGGAPRLAEVANHLRHALGAQRFDECVASGAAMQPAESVRYAREQIELARAAIGKGSCMR